MLYLNVHVLRLEVSQLEQALADSCDKISGEELDEISVITKLFPAKTPYF